MVWEQTNERLYKLIGPGLGYCSLLCANTPGITEQHDIWLLLFYGFEEDRVEVGRWGDDIEQVKRNALNRIISSLTETKTQLCEML